MNPTLSEIYSLALDQWPLVASAYAILWATLMVYIGMTLRRLGRFEKELSVLEEAVQRRTDA